MKDVHIALMAVTSVILFIFGLENFSKEIQKIAGEGFRKFLGRATKFSLMGVGIGAIVTAFIQSSSATSVIAISLVNAGVLSFKNSVGIIFGSNIGTTITAQLIAFKLTAFAPVFIILGFLLSFVKSKYSVFGKALFYFGFVFFTLNLISSTLSPLREDERVVSFLTGAQTPMVGILVGCLVTALVQSSSVTTGLAIIFTSQGLMSLDMAIPILMGANIGTTVTALISVINMDISAKKTAMAHFLFNMGGVLIFLPIVLLWGDKAAELANDPAVALANFHFIFNVVTSLIFIFFLRPFVRLINVVWGEGKMDFERLDLNLFKDSFDYEKVQSNLSKELKNLFFFIQENYNLVTLSIESNYRGIYETVQKRMEYIDFVKSEFLDYFSHIMGEELDDSQSQRLFDIVRRYEYIFQIHDSLKDLTDIKKRLDKGYIELKSDLLVMVRELSSETLLFFNEVSKNIEKEEGKQEGMIKQAKVLQGRLNDFNRDILKLISMPKRQDAGIILHLMTYSQRLKDKLTNYYELFGHGS